MSNRPGRWWLPFLLFFLVVGVTIVVGLLLWQVRVRETAAQILPGWSIIRPPHEVSALAVDGDIIWAGGRDGVWRLDQSGEGAPVELECDMDLSYVRALIIDDNGVLWIGHSSGLSYASQGDCRTYLMKDGLPVSGYLRSTWTGKNACGWERMAAQPYMQMQAGRPLIVQTGSWWIV